MNARLTTLQKHLIHEAAIIEDPTNLLYLTGLCLSRGILMVTKDDAVLFVDGRYFATAERHAPCPIRLLKEGGLEDLREWLEGRNVKHLSFDSTLTTYDRFTELAQSFSGIELAPQKAMLLRQRSIKDGKELALLKKAQALTYRGFQHVESLLREGVTEEELAFEFEQFVRKHGASGLSFGSIIAFGENGAYPHYRAGKAKLQRNQAVLIDVGAIVDEYKGDLTRVVFFGEPNPMIQKWLKLTQQAQKKALDAIRPGVSVKELDLAARSVFKEHGVEEKFIHGLGHGVGLEVHEFPSLKSTGADRDIKLVKGMVVTIEPGLYEPGIGGVRWEDMICVTDDGYERF